MAGEGALPLIVRNAGAPGFADLSERQRRGLEEPERRPKIRLVCFYGTADQFASWAPTWLAGAPEWVETIVYEARGHGLRDGEPLDENFEAMTADAWEHIHPTLKQHAADGEACGAPFALLGHSLGAQVVVRFAKRLKEELGLEPNVVYILDTAPPCVPLLSEEGLRFVREDPFAFFEIFHPETGKLLRSSREAEVGKAMLRKWQGSFIMGAEDLLPEGYHKFGCHIVVFVGTAVYQMDKEFKKGSMPPEMRAAQSRRSKLLQSAEDSAAVYDEKQFNLWRGWTNKSSVTVQISTDHFSIKVHGDVLKLVWRELGRLAKVDQKGK